MKYAGALAAFAVAIILMAAPVPGSAQQAPVTLAQAVDAAWARSARSVEAAGQMRTALADRSAASALLAAPPALELGVLDNRQRSHLSSRETEMSVALPLWLPGQRSARIGAAQARHALAAEVAAAGRLRIAGVVLDAAWGIEIRKAELASAEARHAGLDALANDVTRRVDAGDLAAADLLAVEAERLAATAGLTQARQDLNAASLRWTALTGLSEPLPLEAPGETALTVPTEEHPELRLAARAVDLARHRLEVVKSSRRDAPELSARLRQEVSRGPEPNTHGIGLALRIPLGTAARNEPMLAAALSELELVQASHQELRRQLAADQATTRAAVDAAQLQLADQERRARLLRERFRLVEKSFKAGETPLPELLRTLTAADEADAALRRQRAALGQAAARLQLTLGTSP